MFKLFSNIFENSDPDRIELPKALLKAAIERTVDGTDPRLRMLPGYAKKLREPVLHAADHVVRLARNLPEPVRLSRGDFMKHPALAAIFYSAERLEQVICHDAALKEFAKTHPLSSDPVYALLAVHKREKQVLGIALVNDEMRKDVAQTTVSFNQHWLVDPSHSEEQTRRLLMRRIFDRLLGIALSRLVERREERDSLSSYKALLKCKLEVLGRSGCLDNEPREGERLQLEARMAEIEQQLSALGPDHTVLPANLATIAEVLGEAERHLWHEETFLCLDRYYVLQDKPSPSVPEIAFQRFHDSEREGILVLMVQIGAEQSSLRPRGLG